jgi:hypothetical protein
MQRVKHSAGRAPYASQLRGGVGSEAPSLLIGVLASVPREHRASRWWGVLLGGVMGLPEVW